MYKIIILITLTFVVEILKAQVRPPLAIEEYSPGLNPVDEIPLFDLDEIKKRKIDTAYIIYHPASWAEYEKTINPCTCPYNDTLSLYRFDSEGRIIQYTYYQQLGDYSTTFHYDSTGNITARDQFRRIGAKKGTTRIPYDNLDTASSKVLITVKRSDKDRIVTKIFLLKFTHGLDTATIETKKYNSKGQLVEVQSSVNKKNAHEFGDDTGSSTYHFKYEYDNKGRLVFFRDFESREFEKISYPFYGKLTEIYNASTGKLIERRVKVINEQNGVITVTFSNGSQVVLTPLEKGSKLFKLKSAISHGEFPLMEYFEIIYK